jgi:hypothetical protein
MAIEFGAETEFSGDLVDELNRLYDRGQIRVLDLAVVRMTEEGEPLALRASNLTLREIAEMGSGIKRLLGIAGESGVLSQAVELIQPNLLAQVDVGLIEEDLQQFVEELEPGEAVVVILFEHTWAARFAEIVRLDGGSLALHGFLTEELAEARGAELAAISEAAASIELAEALRGAAYLDALRSLQELQHLKSAVAAETVRVLMAAGLLPDEAATEAIDVLWEAALLDDAALDLAETAVAEAEAEVAAASAPEA